MNTISCVINFRENFTKNISYYKLLLHQTAKAQSELEAADRIDEHAALSCTDTDCLLSKICEGYQFVIAFDGNLRGTDDLKNELSSLGYCFITSSEAELVLNAYIHFGDKCPEKLSGSFSFVIYDAMRRRIFAGCDALASRPLFYGRCGEDILITSHINGILAHPSSRAVLTKHGVQKLLSFTDSTDGDIFDGIFCLKPAHTLKIDHDGIFSLKYTAKSSISENPCLSVSSVTELLKNHCGCGNDTGVIMTGTTADALLCEALAQAHAESSRRISSYSFCDVPDVARAYSCAHTKIPFSSDALRSAITASVHACGIPLLSEVDFMLPMIFEHIPKSSGAVFMSMPCGNIYGKPRALGDIMYSHRAFSPPVAQTLSLDRKYPPDTEQTAKDAQSCGAQDSVLCRPFCFGKLIADKYNIELRSPYTDNDVFGTLLSSSSEIGTLLLAGYPDRESDACSIRCGFGKRLYDSARRMLLEIIADSSAPILAFFEKSALLRLCEGGFDIPAGRMTPTALIIYIIKLNIWFLEYRPKII